MKKAIFQIISCFFFALLGLQIKKFSSNTNIESIVFFRSLLGSIIIIILVTIFKRKNTLNFPEIQNFRIFILRSIFGTCAMYFGYKALTFISLSQATTIGFTKVFFTVVLSSIFLNEKISKRTFIFVLIGFLGVYLIADPKYVDINIGIYLSIFSAFAVSGGIITIVFLTKKEDTLKILFLNSLISTFIYAIIFFDKISIDFNESSWSYLSITCTALLGQYFNTESYKQENASRIILMSYSRIIFASIFGYSFLNETLSFNDLLGFFIIVITTMIVSRKSKKIKNQGHG